MVALRDSKLWDRQLEEELPDCRLTGMARERKSINVGRMALEQVFCANCGGDQGFVFKEATPFIYALCDHCVTKMGAPAGAVRLSEDDEKAARGQI